MPRFDITNESTEDTLDSTHDLQDAVRMALEAARTGTVGDPVSIEQDGKCVKQFILLKDGTVRELEITAPLPPVLSLHRA
ncbi:hypothetical protein [Fimbriiglobus ruber]|uniref:Uncharacterized protein n=1 Tax=Fimbriiglobus ruber TaxID=1908690 RepID=A0A225DLR6_9BACT|nr:hypothetical protein [Fimbriiglobus ruber]OWK38149.1 hypothetical protein FRUB_07269 [Fimbriiglobus ruber]